MRPERMHSLDALRGVAALSVVLFHWQHFFYSGTTPGAFDRARLPLSSLGRLFYEKGWWSVDLFFCLSGFIFFHLYARVIAGGGLSAARFAWLRFSRIYPLHLVTLVVVLVGQALALQTIGHTLVYGDYDATHLLLNLGLVSSWGSRLAVSFNGPAWSISVEAALYALFFVFCRSVPVRPWTLALAALIGFFGVERVADPLSRGIGSFFVGGCVVWAYRRLRESEHAVGMAKAALAVAMMAWAVTVWMAYAADARLLLRLTQQVLPSALAAWTAARIGDYWPVMVLFPVTVLALAMLESWRGSMRVAARLGWLGNISYSSYLWHFPLQLVTILAVTTAGVGTAIFYEPAFMVSFFLVLVGVSVCSYRYIEVPAQAYLRRLWTTTPEAARPETGTLPGKRAAA